MNINLKEGEALVVLTSLLEKYMNAKAYFAECKKEEDTIGMTTPDELKDTYNNLLKQMQDADLFAYLELLG
jgi:hypothetical protein